MDRDTFGDIENIDVAEGVVGHHWNYVETDKDKKKPVLYDFNPKLERDMIYTANSLRKAEDNAVLAMNDGEKKEEEKIEESKDAAAKKSAN